MDKLREEIGKRIRAEHWGADGGWHIFLDDKEVFSTKNPYEKGMFVAELTERLMLVKQTEKLPMRIVVDKDSPTSGKLPQ